jgi:hypothetical protein
LEPGGQHRRGLTMSNISAKNFAKNFTKNFTAMLSIATIGAALCFGIGAARAGVSVELRQPDAA